MPAITSFRNPFRPGAGQMPPHLAGREQQIDEFRKLLRQDIILENLVLTGLRGSGKTVLLDTLKPIAIENQWLWVGTDLSETASLSEESIATRLLADLSVVTSNIIIHKKPSRQIGFVVDIPDEIVTLNYNVLAQIYSTTPGLAADKIKNVLLYTWQYLKDTDSITGVIFAYDEAQHLSDHAAKDQYPLSNLLDVFQSIQKQGIPFMLVLTGLPTLFPKLVEARTFAERMFHIIVLDHLSSKDSREAILKPIKDGKGSITFNDESVATIVEVSGGYPYFIQFICREVFDVFIQKKNSGEEASVPVNEIIRKLDADFFAGRYARVTDRQRDLLQVIASLTNCDTEFTVQEIAEFAKQMLDKPFSKSHVNQMLNTLADAGLVYRKRPGKYSFAVPLFGQFIRRQMEKSPF